MDWISLLLLSESLIPMYAMNGHILSPLHEKSCKTIVLRCPTSFFLNGFRLNYQINESEND